RRSSHALDAPTQPIARHRAVRRPTVASDASLAILIAALIAKRRAAKSPLVWSDTFNDQSDVNRCLAENVSTLVAEANFDPRLLQRGRLPHGTATVGRA